MSLETVVNNPIFSLAGFALSFFSILLAILFFRWGKRDRVPTYFLASKTIDSDEREQEKATVVNLGLWNTGLRTINAADLVEAVRFGIVVLPGAEVRDCRILEVTDKSNEFEIGEKSINAKGETFIPIKFKYFDNNEGVLIELVHNGEANHKISMSGKIKGAKGIRKERDTTDYRQHVDTYFHPMYWGLFKEPKDFRLLGWSGSALYAVCGIVLVIGTLQENSEWYWLLLGAIFVFIGYLHYREFCRETAPAELRSRL